MEQLAILGGRPLVTEELAQSAYRPPVSERAIEEIVDMLRRGETSFSPTVRKFEAEFVDYIGAPYALCTCNGTTAIQAALFAAGVKPGDEVIVPSYTFWASAAPIAALFAKPVFCDVNEETYTIDPDAIEACITERTRAIICVHVWGNPCDLDAIRKIAEPRGIAIIEDCAHAHGATLHGKKLGTIGDAGAFSFQGTKIMIAGEGGMLVTNDPDRYARAVALGHYERVKDLPEDSPYRAYFLTGMGFKHRMHPLGAPIARYDLETLDEMNELRDSNAKKLDAMVADLPFISLQKVLPDARRVYSYHYARYHKESLGGVSISTFLKAAKAEGLTIGTCGYGHLHEAPFFTEGMDRGDRVITGELPVTSALADETFLMAPRFEGKCDELITAYGEVYHKLAKNIDALKKLDAEAVDTAPKTMKGNSINLL